MKAYFGKESAEYQQINPKGFKKSFDTYQRELKRRIKTFESHGRGESKSARKLREALYDMVNANTTAEQTKAFSRASFVLTSARGSYSRAREVDMKIVNSLNEEFSVRNEETGEIVKKFITLNQLEDFADIMDSYEGALYSAKYGSAQTVRVIREVMSRKPSKNKTWKEMSMDVLSELNKNSEDDE